MRWRDRSSFSVAGVFLVGGVFVVGACSSGGSTDTAEAPGPSASEVDVTAYAVEITDTEDTDSEDADTDTVEITDTEDADSEDADSEDTDTDDADTDAEPAGDPLVVAALKPVAEGDSGEEVEALQQRLSDLGLAPGTVDGDYGARTVASIKAFQGLVGIPVTGKATEGTIERLIAYRYDGVVLRAGDEGRDVETLQARLATGPFDPGPVDGEYGGKMVQAVWALEKLAGIPVDGDWGPLDELAWEQLEAGRVGKPEMDHDQRWVEVDLSEQLVKIYEPDEATPVLVSHASSGSGVPWSNEEHSGSSVTPRGDFHIDRRIAGWRESSLGIGRLYNPLYFRGGIALHGSPSVPLYPASHGCIRLPMHIAEYLPDELPNGTPVHVLD
jgi:peptidoglycan hydrolase-like protein with peptidoglycan-binding domain